MGAMTNQDDPSVGSGVGQKLEVMLNPTPLLSSLRFRAAGSSQVAGRATVTAHATPRPQDPRYGRSIEFHELGTGAHHYQLEVDQERGVLLAVTAIRDEQPFHKITTLAIRFDEATPAETFQFTPREGEEIQPTQDRHRPQHVTLTEAQQRAPFTVLMPDHVPASWQIHCTFLEASKRPPSPTQVSVGYVSGDEHESISIDQMAAADRAAHHYEETWSTTTIGRRWRAMGRRSRSDRLAGVRRRHTSNATEHSCSSSQTTSQATKSQRSQPASGPRRRPAASSSPR